MEQSLLLLCLTLFCNPTLNAADTNPQCLQETIDPCNKRNYATLSDVTRSSGYISQASETQSDYGVLSRWYRSVSPVGGDMPMDAPDLFACDAYSPMWMNGELPDANDGIVKRKVCVVTLESDCARFINICVKNCGTYNVYHLYTPTGTTDRYCFGTETQCPKGQSSPTGFTPGCKVQTEIFRAEPKLTYEVKDIPLRKGLCKGTVFYKCNINHADKNQRVKVQWYVNDVEVDEEKITVADFPAELSSEKIVDSKVVKKYPFKVTCKLTPVDANLEMSGFPKTVDFDAGYSVQDTVLEVSEGGIPAEYAVEFSVPCTCNHRCNLKKICPLYINVEVPYFKHSREVANCKEGGGKQDEVVFKRAKAEEGDRPLCTSVVKMSQGNNGGKSLFKLPVHARLDGRYDGTKELLLQLATPKELDDKLCQDITFPRAKVVVADRDVNIKGKYCSFYNDPHAKTFDGRLYEMQLSGFFTLYRHKELPLEVQGYFKNAGRYSKVCGAAIRSGGELYVINYCGGRGFYNKLYECEKLQPGVTNLKVVQNGRNYQIFLPSGGKVNVSPSRINIHPSLADSRKTEGLCGTLNSNQQDDLKFKDTERIGQGRYPNDFSNSWKLNDDESLFYGKIKDERKFGDAVFCGCSQPNEATCGYTENLKYCVQRGNDVTDKLKRICGIMKRQAEEFTDEVDDSDDMDFEFDDTIPPPAEWINEWTEEKASAFCTKFYKRPTVELCLDMPGVNITESIEACIEDIHITGTTNYATVQLEIIISNCVTEIEKNDTLAETVTGTNDDGKNISMTEELLGQLCDNDCNDHGECIEGVCKCEDSYMGEDCSVDVNKVPILLPLPFKGLCDKHHRPCEATSVHADIFVESNNLTCVTEVFTVEKEKFGQQVYQKAEYDHFQKVMCMIPEHKTLPYIVKVAVSNNGLDYSDPKDLLVYDSTCWSCDENTSCTRKESSCIIKEECYGKQETNPENSEEICDPDKSKTMWTAGSSVISCSWTQTFLIMAMAYLLNIVIKV